MLVRGTVGWGSFAKGCLPLGDFPRFPAVTPSNGNSLLRDGAGKKKAIHIFFGSTFFSLHLLDTTWLFYEAFKIAFNKDKLLGN